MSLPAMSIAKPMPTVSRRPWPLWMGLLLVTLIMLAVAWQRQQPPVAEQSVELKWQRLLRFEDRPGGDIAIIDAKNRQEVARLQGEHGFARGALRTLARERMRRELGPELPFELSAYVDGKLVLRDPATGERIHLEAFGASNVAVFAQLHHIGLTAQSSSSSPGASP
jgi:putative photosynthetic complex assembly protein